MNLKRFAATAAVAAVSLGGVAAPAMASSQHASASHCKSLAKAWAKKYPHATSKQKTAYDKTLKALGCKITVS